MYIPYVLFISLKEVNAKEGDEITALKYLLNVSMPPLSAPLAKLSIFKFANVFLLNTPLLTISLNPFSLPTFFF